MSDDVYISTNTDDVEEVDIPTETVQEEFKEFLDRKNNKRIFFSAPYGTGKTRFLNQFFTESIYSDCFTAFHLSPVNYQITSNENILEFLKYDTISELTLKDSKIFEKSDDQNLISLLPGFLNENKGDLAKTAISYLEGTVNIFDKTFTLSKLGRPLKDMITVSQEFGTYKDKNLSSKQIEHYLARIKNDPRLNSETDLISIAIKKALLKYQESNKDSENNLKRNVLILDDIDRVDPDHIFRLLNTFSAHTMKDENEVKFGFDHIIIVGDIENIKHIFHHKYGDGAHFSGYFDKFTSIKPFSFSLRDSLRFSLDQKFENVKTNWEGIHKDRLHTFLSEILLRLYEFEESNLRQVLKPLKYDLTALNKVYSNNLYSSRTVRASLDLIEEIYDEDRESLVDSLHRLRKNLDQSWVDTQAVYSLMNGGWIRELLRLLGCEYIKQETVDFIYEVNGTRYKFVFGMAYHPLKDLRFEHEINYADPTPIHEVKLYLFYDLVIEYFTQDIRKNSRYE